MESDFRTILITDTGVTDLVPENRIAYLDVDQEKVNPRITYRVVSTVVSEELDAESNYTKHRVQVDCWADSDPDLVALANAVRIRLIGFDGIVGDTDFAGIFRTSRRDLPARPIAGKERGERRMSMDFEVHVVE